MTGSPKWYRPWSAYGDPKGYAEDVWKKSPVFAGPQLIGKELKKLQPKTPTPIPTPDPSPIPVIVDEMTRAKSSARAKKTGRKRNILAGRMSGTGSMLDKKQILKTRLGE